MQLTSNGIDYHLTIHQQEGLPFLLLLHGFMGSSNAFSHLIEELTEFCNPVTVDLLGHGRTGGSRDPDRYRTPMQAGDLRQIIHFLDADALFLHGYSMGGRLALQFAVAYPGYLDGLILESANPGFEDQAEAEQRMAADEKRATEIEKNFGVFLDRWGELSLFDSTAPVAEELLQTYSRIQRDQDPTYMAASLRGFGTGSMPGVKGHLSSLPIPVLLIGGVEDKKYRAILSEMHRLIPESSLNILDKTGHRVHIERPEEFVSTIRSFLTNNQSI